MAIFAVTYTYVAEAQALDEIRKTHREFFSELLAQGVLLASGPMVDTSGALLILSGKSVEEVAHLLDSDPFEIAGFIGERAITEWNPVFGPWSAK
jgi:uncharacterized protein YciI